MSGEPRNAWMLLAAIPFVFLLWVTGGAVAERVRELNTGEDVTVTDVSGCVEDGPPMSGRFPYCSASWRFDDGRTGHGRIDGEKVAKGDRIFAGDGFAYLSRSNRVLSLVMVALAGLVLLGMLIGLGVLYRMDRARRRRGK
ncbi:hypothetical protein ACFORH_08885 [Amycolatopsis roodepoortensis]|uniref:DUF3592 domain-containing protein n=1 Tax=Amycolatopsis roodepoortensis TaxID=700274 RepID=A0ABR9L9P5_9PSEU|nr:hypothetical protein [Amycolatopsis roodepoortensis]MBE1577282.1 hypothetical protein [Amycolatopsis roodepoortensis]